MDLRGTMVVGMFVVALAGIFGEGDAAACPQVRHAALVRRRAHPTAAPRTGRAEREAGSFEQYNVDRVNELRRAAGVPPVAVDTDLMTFAREGTAQLMRDHRAHAHFAQAGDSMWQRGFRGGAAENQGAPTGWPRAAADSSDNERRQIDDILASMMREGPGGGHHDNILNPKMRRVGVGLAEDSEGKLYLTNDFSG